MHVNEILEIVSFDGQEYVVFYALSSFVWLKNLSSVHLNKHLGYLVKYVNMSWF